MLIDCCMTLNFLKMSTFQLQSLILRQVASARAVITDLLSSSTERTLAMSRIQILWLSNQISANTHLNIYHWSRNSHFQNHGVVSSHHYTTIFRCFSSSICMTQDARAVKIVCQWYWRKHSNRIDTGPFAGLTGIFRSKRCPQEMPKFYQAC